MILSNPLKSKLIICSRSKKIPTKRINLRNYSTLDFLEKTKSYIKNNNVMVFSKSYCPYSSQAKAMFTKMNVDHEVLELDQISMNFHPLQSLTK